MPEKWMVTVNGHRQFFDLDSYEDAWEKATRWGKGLCKHQDPKSHSLHVEIKRDKQSEKEFDDEYKRWKEGRDQDWRIIEERS